jgi:hypothetical protein
MLAVAILINDVGKNMEVRKWVLGIFLPPSSYQIDEVGWQANDMRIERKNSTGVSEKRNNPLDKPAAFDL